MARAEAISVFAFDDLAAKPVKSADGPATFTAEDVEAARAEGMAAGREAAELEQARERNAEIAALTASLAKQADAINHALDAERRDIQQAGEQFLAAFARTLATERELAAARDLLQRILHEPRNRAPVTLSLAPSALKRIGDDLNAAIADAGAADFITVAADEKLADGDCTAMWTGGAMRRELAAALAAIDDLFNDPLAARAPHASPSPEEKKP